MVNLLLTLLATAAAIDVGGDASCPSPAEVTAALAGLIAPARPATAGSGSERLEVAGRGAVVSIRLWSADQELIAERRLPQGQSCAERAQAAAVIAAAWEAHLRAGAVPMSPLSGGALPPGAIAQPPPSHPQPPSSHPVVTRAATPPPPEPIRVVTGGALLASVAAGGVAPAVAVDGALVRPGAAFDLVVGALAVGTHSLSLASGRGSWRRVGGFAGLQTGSVWQRVAVELQASVALTAVSITGESFPTTSSATVFDPGGMAALRLRLRGERLSPWLEAAAAFWPRTHSLFVMGSTDSAELPGFEAFLGAGVSFGRDRP
jgi:hypothetical protein